MRAALAHAQHGLLAGSDDGVAADDEVGRRHAHAGGADGLLAVANQHMAPGGTALLRKTAGVLRNDALAFDVRGHAQQLANGDHARAADASHDDAVSPVDLRQHRFGQRAHFKR